MAGGGRWGRVGRGSQQRLTIAKGGSIRARARRAIRLAQADSSPHTPYGACRAIPVRVILSRHAPSAGHGGQQAAASGRSAAGGGAPVRAPRLLGEAPPQIVTLTNRTCVERFAQGMRALHCKRVTRQRGSRSQAPAGPSSARAPHHGAGGACALREESIPPSRGAARCMRGAAAASHPRSEKSTSKDAHPTPQAHSGRA